MTLTIFLNNGKIASVDCHDFSNGDAHTLARQVSRCDLVHTVRAQNDDGSGALCYVNGLTEEGA